MKRLAILLTILINMVSARTLAYDIEVENDDGVTIYYNFINNGTELEVTVDGDVYISTNCYSGNIIIPEIVRYGSKTYNVTSIGEAAFLNCYSLTSVTIPNSVTSIGNDAFEGCSRLASVTIGNSVTSIGNSAFHNCYSLASVTIPNSVTSIGSHIFYNCSSLASVTIGNSVTSIGQHAFYRCSSLASVTIPNSVTSIDFFAFMNCSGLTSVVIPNSVTSIGSAAFNGCSSLASVTIGNSVTSIGSFAFNECSGLTSIIVADGNPVYDSRDNCNAIIETDTNTLFQGCLNTTIPNSVTSIGDCAFHNCSGLTSVVIPNSVTSIGNSAFVGCSGLESVTIGNSVTSIGNDAFWNCYSLASVVIPNSVTSIGNNVFAYCSSLASMTIGNSVTSIGNDAFYGCSGLTSIIVADGNPVYDSRDNCNAIIETDTNTLLQGCLNTTIPNSVTSIGNNAFWNCSGLTSVTIPNSVTSIGNNAFNGCSKLEHVTIVDGETRLTLGYNSNSGEGLFYDCPITTLYLGRNLSYDKSEKHGYSPFNGKNTLQEVTIGNSVTSIDNYAFEGCSSLESVTIGNSVTSIGYKAFQSCSGLKSVTIGNSVTSIEYSVFDGCNSLTSLYSLNTTPPSVDFGNFTANQYRTLNVYVPQEALAAYQSADIWKKFWSLQGFDPTGIDATLMNDGERTVKDVYDLGGKQLSQPQQGLNIVKMSDGTTKKVVINQ